MKLLLTGANGYIGKRLLPLLLAQGHEVICAVRDRKRFHLPERYPGAPVIPVEVDFLKTPTAEQQQQVREIDAAYYLIHSMSDRLDEFEKLEATSARNFIALLAPSKARQIIYLGGITNDQALSKHLASRKQVDDILRGSGIPVTTLKAGIIVGSGSSSFEIIRDLVEKLPVMITPRWLNTRTQPIAIRNVLEFLSGVLLRTETFRNSYDIGGPDVMTYKEMLLQFAEIRGLRRFIFTLPVMTPRTSSYWLYFVTATSYKLAVNLVNSMKVEVVARPNDLYRLLGIELISYRKAVKLAFQKIDQNDVVSSWKDSLVSSYSDNSLLAHVQVPVKACFIDSRQQFFETPVSRVLDNLWSIGGNRGWYYANWLWLLRGFLDKLNGGVGLRRGRRSATEILPGDTLDFWRVLVADRSGMRLLLYAEMKLPGEAWLEFRITPSAGGHILHQTATFRPKGIAGRMYWYSVLPFHFFLFGGLMRTIISFVPPVQEQVVSRETVIG
ncbi:MAG: SDR family oxidoreductase [Bacteroidota bacterium]